MGRSSPLASDREMDVRRVPPPQQTDVARRRPTRRRGQKCRPIWGYLNPIGCGWGYPIGRRIETFGPTLRWTGPGRASLRVALVGIGGGLAWFTRRMLAAANRKRSWIMASGPDRNFPLSLQGVSPRGGATVTTVDLRWRRGVERPSRTLAGLPPKAEDLGDA
jgi:hypothetical protein